MARIRIDPFIHSHSTALKDRAWISLSLCLNTIMTLIQRPMVSLWLAAVVACSSALLWSSQVVNGFHLPPHSCRSNSRITANDIRARTALAATPPTKNNAITNAVVTVSRRNLLQNILSTSLVAVTAGTVLLPPAAWASGGATAGRYTTIPIAKRRYYGRVQEAVHEFLFMGADVVKSDMTAPYIQLFFDPQGALIVAARRQDVNGQCTKKDNSCKGKEIRDSRYNDMKASMYLLGNAFRTDQQKPPDRLPTVKAAKAFFKEMDDMEKLVKKKKTNDPDAVQHYAAALDILDRYLDLVELPPIDSGHYDKEFDTLVGTSARIT